MATIPQPGTLVEEIADFLATRPTREEILTYRPSADMEARFRDLVAKNRQTSLSAEEEDELDQFEKGELLMQLVKARLRLAEKQAS